MTARVGVVARHLEAYELARRLKNGAAMVAACDALTEQFGLAKVGPQSDEPLTVILTRMIVERDENGEMVRRPYHREPVASAAPVIDDIPDAEAERVMELFEQHGQVPDDEQDACEFIRSLLSSEQEAERVEA